MSSTKIDHTNTRCHICKSDRTGKNFAGNPHWIRYKDKNGKWDRESYICIRCYDCIRLEFDHILLVCMDEKRENIERIYIIPRKYAIRRSGITILQDQIRDAWYAEFMVEEKHKKHYNDAYHSLMEYLKDKKYFGIEDVKKWLNE